MRGVSEMVGLSSPPAGEFIGRSIPENCVSLGQPLKRESEKRRNHVCSYQSKVYAMEEKPKGVKYSIRPFASGGCAACFSTCCVGAVILHLEVDFPF